MGSQCSERTRGETWQCFEDFPLKKNLTKTIYNCIAPVGFLPWEIRVAFPGESQLRQSRSTQPTVHAGCFSVSIIHRTLTWTTGSLTCAQVLMHAFAHGAVRTHRKLTLGEKSLAAPGNRTSVSGVTVWCSANELHPHPLYVQHFSDFFFFKSI